MPAYCIEPAAKASVCEESEVARDFCASIYASALTLGSLGDNGTEKIREVLADLRRERGDVELEATENIVSGIEYATVMSDGASL